MRVASEVVRAFQTTASKDCFIARKIKPVYPAKKLSNPSAGGFNSEPLFRFPETIVVRIQRHFEGRAAAERPMDSHHFVFDA